MPKPVLKNLQTITARDPQLGATLTDIQSAITNISDGALIHPSGKSIAPPPPIVGMSVVGAGGIHHITLTDGTAPIARGIEYHIEVDTSPAFTNPVGISLGPHRSYRGSLGSGALFFRSFSQYNGSAPNQPYMHPVSVDAGGSAGPAFLPSTGSGTSSCTKPTAGGAAGISATRLSVDGRPPVL